MEMLKLVEECVLLHGTPACHSTCFIGISRACAGFLAQMIGLTQTAAAKLCADKIRVNCVAPTAVATVRLVLLPMLSLLLTPSRSTGDLNTC